MTGLGRPVFGRDGLVTTLVETAEITERRAALRRLVAAILRCDLGQVEIAHEPGRAPRLLAPVRDRLCLSSASRGPVAALAAAGGPVGIDVERAEEGRAPPWGVLHPDERMALGSLSPGEAARAFAQIWSGKEAYLKALGVGLFREPSSFRVLIDGTEALRVDDPARTGGPVDLRTSWTERADGLYAVTTALLPNRIGPA